MYVAMGIYDDGVIVTVMNTFTNKPPEPVLFATTDEAWERVDEIMNSPSHPRMMWLNKIKENIYADT